MRTSELTTPALLVDASRLERNLATMAEALPGHRLRPHVKAHKCTALAARQAAHGHRTFTCATTAEMEGMVRAGLGDDLLLANEVADASRLGALARQGARVTLAVDSEATMAERARAAGLEVRGVMGYEGHIVGLEDRATRETMLAESMALLLRAGEEVGGDVISAGGTGTYYINTWATEIQAGSYVLM